MTDGAVGPQSLAHGASHRSRLTVAYVHTSPAEHGVSRYGRLLAAEARRSARVRIVEAEVEISPDRLRSWRNVRRAARAVRAADVVHVQYNHHGANCVWGAHRWQLVHLWTLAFFTRGALVVTVHDVYEGATWSGIGGFARERLRRLVRRLRPATRPRAEAQTAPSTPSASGARVTRVDSADAFTLWWLSRRARLLLVCSQEERRRVAHILPSVRAQVVAHFVESRPPIPSMTDAKASLGLSGQRVVTLLGFIHGRKGHDLLVDAMPRLAPDVTVVFAGGATAEHEAYVERLRDRARTLGVAHRLRVTGRLAEPELERWMACTDLAVCPFVRVAASGSVSTWLSLGKPILATDLPLIAEYNAMEPGAIRCFRPYTATALADAITSVLSEADDRQAEAAGRLRDHLSIAAVCERHLALLTEHIQASTTVKNAAPSMVTHGASC